MKRIKKVMAEHEELGQRLRLKMNRQEKHVLGSEECSKYFNEGDYPSYFSSDTDLIKLHEHILEKMNMDKNFNRYQHIDIGNFDGITAIGNKPNYLKSDQIRVHQSNNGIHGVPNTDKRR